MQPGIGGTTAQGEDMTRGIVWGNEPLPTAPERGGCHGSPIVRGGWQTSSSSGVSQGTPLASYRLRSPCRRASARPTTAASAQPAAPARMWDRQPRPPPGRLRRVRSPADVPTDVPLPACIRAQAAGIDHLPKGFWGPRRHATAAPPPPAPRSALPDTIQTAA